MDLTIPHNVWPILKENLDELLAIAGAHSTRRLSDLTGAAYVLEAIAAGRFTPNTSRKSCPAPAAARANVRKAAKAARAKAARNDGRRRGAPPLVPQFEEEESSSDSDVPLSQQVGSIPQSTGKKHFRSF
jgi:hypothetical protein